MITLYHGLDVEKCLLDKQTLDQLQSLCRRAGDCAKYRVCDIVFCRSVILFVHCGPATMCDIVHSVVLQQCMCDIVFCSLVRQLQPSATDPMSQQTQV